MYCYLCGTQILDGDSYCRNCGEISAALPASKTRNRWLYTTGNFLLGAVLFLAAAVLTATLLSNSPQFTILMFLIFGSLLGGLSMVMFKRLRGNSVRERQVAAEKKLSQTSDPPLLDQPKERFIHVPPSVTETTTTKLKNPRG